MSDIMHVIQLITAISDSLSEYQTDGMSGENIKLYIMKGWEFGKLITLCNLLLFTLGGDASKPDRTSKTAPPARRRLVSSTGETPETFLNATV